MRRKSGALVPLESDICASAAELRGRGVDEFHGYELAKQLAKSADRQRLTAYGTLYRALNRLEDMGLLSSRWEDPTEATRERRPLRRLYTLTARGEAVVNEARKVAAQAARAGRRVARA
jgi:DNA-binding PadR family transcriptional regulator